MLGLEALNFTKESKFGQVSDDFGIDSLKCKGNEADIRLTVITSACLHVRIKTETCFHSSAKVMRQTSG